jgi:hypothetical protein
MIFSTMTINGSKWSSKGLSLSEEVANSLVEPIRLSYTLDYTYNVNINL